MLKRLMIAALLLPMASLALAHGDGPHPGEDNPGSTTVEEPFFFGGFANGDASCFVAVDFCADTNEDPIVPAFDGLRGKQRREAQSLASEYAALACAAAESYAGAEFGLWFEGGGTLTLTRHGNHGAMHHINFEAGLASGTATVAAAGAAAGASASASAVAAAGVYDMDEVCAMVAEEDLPPDHPAVELCATWEAYAFAASAAFAEAGAFAASEAMAASGAYGAVTNQTEVWGANIEKFVSVATTAAGSFSTANAAALAETFAGAYTAAFAEAFIDICADINDGDLAEVCDSWDDVDQAYAEAYAVAFATAQAAAFAETSIEVLLPATYVNENGIEDTISFGPEASVFAQAALLVNCSAQVFADAGGDDEPSP